MGERLTDKGVKHLKAPSDRPYYDIWDAAVSGLGIRINAGGRKAWHLKTRIAGRQRRFAIGSYPSTSLANARRKALDLLDLIDRGIDPRAEAENRRREQEQQALHTFGALAAQYLNAHVARLRSAREVRRIFERDMIPVFGDCPVGEIRRADIHRFLDEAAESRPVLANRMHSHLSGFFSWLVDREITAASPMHRMRKRVDERPRQRDRVLNDDEIVAVWHAADRLGRPFGTLAKLLLLSGQRLREVAHATWGEFDFDESVWLIGSDRMKGGRQHALPLAQQTVQIISSLPRLGPYILTTRGDVPISGFSKAKIALGRQIAADGGPIPPWRWHDIRRSVATGWRRQGVDRLVVGKLLAHSDSSVTGVYDRHRLEQEQRDAVEAWGRHIFSLMAGG